MHGNTSAGIPTKFAVVIAKPFECHDDLVSRTGIESLDGRCSSAHFTNWTFCQGEVERAVVIGVADAGGQLEFFAVDFEHHDVCGDLDRCVTGLIDVHGHRAWFRPDRRVCPTPQQGQTKREQTRREEGGTLHVIRLGATHTKVEWSYEVTVLVMPDNDWSTSMGAALAEAKAAVGHDDVPVGAVVLDAAGNIVAARHNERELTGDPTAHAEILALRDAAEHAGSWRLDGHTLVVTLEPCVMCAGAAQQARIDRVVFGAMDMNGGALGSLYNVGADPRFAHEFDVVMRVAEADCAQPLTEFFASRR